MAVTGLVEDILGHISIRLDGDHILVRCRGRDEAGLLFTEPDDIRVVSLADGRVIDDRTGTYAPPSELPIHTSIYRARSDVDCVVHAHPPDVVVCSLAQLPLVPLVGAYDIPATRLAVEGIAVHPRSVLIRNETLAAEMVASLGDTSALVLVGHGVVTVGDSVPQAVLRALQVQKLARLTLGVHAVGRQPVAIPEADIAELPDLGTGFNEVTLWRHHLRSLAAAGHGIDEREGGH